MASEPRKRAEITLEGVEIQVEVVKPDTEFKRIVERKTRPRSKEQLRVDAEAKRLYAEWVRMGKPESLRAIPKCVYVINPDHVDALLAFLRRAVAADGPLPGKQFKYVKEPRPNGKIAIKFLYRDHPPKAS